MKMEKFEQISYKGRFANEYTKNKIKKNKKMS